MSRFRKVDDFVDPPRPPRPEPRTAPWIDEHPDFIVDAEVVEDRSPSGASTTPGSPVPPVPAGQPLLVTVAQLQLAVNDLQREVADKLERIASRLDDIEARSATIADEPHWVRRLETAVEGHAGRSAQATAAAITTMGEQQRAELEQILARLDEPTEPTRPAWVDELRPDDLAAEIIDRLADIREALRLLVG